MRTRLKVLVVSAVGAMLLGSSALPAAAHHIHARVQQNGANAGACVVMALDGHERWISNPRWPDTRPGHPLHVNVHIGKPVTQGGQVIVAVDDLEDLVELGYCNGLLNVR